MSADILIVDDEADIRNLVAGILEDEGFQVVLFGHRDHPDLAGHRGMAARTQCGTTLLGLRLAGRAGAGAACAGSSGGGGRQAGAGFRRRLRAATALDNGYTPSSIILDDPIEIDQGNGEIWRPENYGGAVNSALQLANQNEALAHQQNAGSATSAGAFGGTRQAVQDALTSGQYALANNNMVSNMLNTGYQNAQNTALQIGSQNTANQQQSNLANQNALNSCEPHKPLRDKLMLVSDLSLYLISHIHSA